MSGGGSKPGGPQSKKLAPRSPARGRGYGGPAKGTQPAKQFTNSDPRTRNLSGKRTAWTERKAEIAAKAIGLFEDVLDDDDTYTTENRMLAADRLLDRVIGKPKQAVETSGETTMIIRTGVPRADRD
jgi:hypothetical protein